MSKFTKIVANKEITEKGRVLARKGTKGMVLEIKDNSYKVRFSTGIICQLTGNIISAI